MKCLTQLWHSNLTKYLSLIFSLCRPLLSCVGLILQMSMLWKSYSPPSHSSPSSSTVLTSRSVHVSLYFKALPFWTVAFYGNSFSPLKTRAHHNPDMYVCTVFPLYILVAFIAVDMFEVEFKINVNHKGLIWSSCFCGSWWSQKSHITIIKIWCCIQLYTRMSAPLIMCTTKNN